MNEFFNIIGYFKDDKSPIDVIVTDCEGLEDLQDTDPYTDDDIFFFGLTEKLIAEAIELKEKTAHDFVITGYIRIIV